MTMAEHSGSTRRQFLGHSAAVTGTVASQALAQSPPELTNTGPGQIPRRRFGRHDDQVSILGMGGYSLATAPTLEEAERIAHEAGL
jgi:hypothetical protein